MDDVIFGLIVALRVAVPLAIPRVPLPAILAALVIDAADQTVLAAFDAEPANYQGYDKALDIYYLAIAYLSTLRNWPSRAAFITAQFLWYYRLVGVVAFEFSGARSLLIIFPNTFEYFFIAYEALRLLWDPRRLSDRMVYGLAAAIWIFVKLPQEYWIHVAQLDFTDALSNTWFAVAVAVAAVVVGFVAARLYRRAPAPDWAPNPDVDRHHTTVPYRPADPPPRWLRLVDHPLVEKTVLTGLTVAVFSQLFAVTATVTQIVLACGFVVVVNAWFGELLRRRQVTWQNTAVQFVGLLAINWGALLVYVGLRTRFNAELQPGPTLALLGLLTLIVILYDRYRTIRQNNTAAGAATRAISSGELRDRQDS